MSRGPVSTAPQHVRHIVIYFRHHDNCPIECDSLKVILLNTN